MEFNIPREQSSIIKVFGIGGGGSNAVNHMYRQGIKGVDFIICNTDQQALDVSPVPTKIQLGSSLTDGRGAGSIPDVGRNAAIEDLETIKEILGSNTKMVFITAGMGGGTGTGAAPVIAQAAKEMGILTVGIVTMPFLFEGRKRKMQATEGIETMRENVDTLLVINNDKLRQIFGNLSLRDAFAEADNVLTTAAKGIAEVITVTGQINVDFEDVRTVMTDSGVAIMGSAKASGENRAIKAVENALSSPLLNDNNIEGANYVLLNITYGDNEIMMDEIADITDYIQEEAGNSADVIWGHGYDETLGDDVCVTIIATGFQNNTVDTGEIKEIKKTITPLNAEVPTTLTKSLEQNKPTNTLFAEKEEIAEPFIKKTVTPQQSSLPFEMPKQEVAPEEPVAPIVEKPIIEATPIAEDKTEEIVAETPTQSWDFPVTSTVEKEEEVVAEKPIEETQQKIVHTLDMSDFEEEKTQESPNISKEEVEAEKQTEAEVEAEILAEMEAEKAQKQEETAPFTFNIPSSTKEEKVEDKPTFDTSSVENKANEIPEQSKPAPMKEETTWEPYLKAEEKTVVEPKEPTPPVEPKRFIDRISKLKELSMRLRTPSGIADMENEPAYKRRRVQLEDTPHSSESQVSRYTINNEEEDGESRTRLNKGNSYLHDNVD